MAGLKREAFDAQEAELAALRAKIADLEKQQATGQARPLGRHADLHRGYDRNRPPRPDTIDARMVAQQPHQSPALSTQEALEGALASALEPESTE